MREHDDVAAATDPDVVATTASGDPPEAGDDQVVPGRFDTVRALFGDPDYRRYWGASAAFGLGIWAFLTAMGWSAAQLSDTAFAVSLVTVVYFLPFFLFAIPAGVLADNMDRKKNAMLSRGFSALVGVAMAVLAGTGNLTYPILLISVFLVGLSVITELAARQAFVATLVPPRQLVQASALSSVQGGLMRVAGPVAAGALIGALGDGGGYALFAATGALFVWWFAGIGAPGSVERAPDHEARPVREIVEGMVYLKNHRDALGIVLISISAGMVGWLYLALMPLVARDVLGGGAVLLGVLNMAVGIGSLPGSLGLAVVREDFSSEGRLFVAANLAWGLGIIGFALSTVAAVSVALLVLAGLGFGLQVVLVRTILLRIVEPAYHGRVLGTLMLTYGVNVVGTLAGGSLADLLGVSTVVALSGAMIIASTVAITLWNRNLLRL